MKKMCPFHLDIKIPSETEKKLLYSTTPFVLKSIVHEKEVVGCIPRYSLANTKVEVKVEPKTPQKFLLDCILCKNIATENCNFKNLNTTNF